MTLVGVACTSPAKPDPTHKTANTAPARTTASTTAGDKPAPSPAGGAKLLPLPEGVELVEHVRAQQQRSRDAGRIALVYVGASWCEPCVYFHDAVAAGELDQDFPNLDLIEIDFDAHKAEIQAAGYAAKLLPTFVLPDDAGRGSGVMEQGGIKGPGAVDYLRPRLRALIQKAKRG